MRALSSSSFLVFPWAPGVPAGLCMYPLPSPVLGGVQCCAGCLLKAPSSLASGGKGSRESAACPLGQGVFSHAGVFGMWPCIPAFPRLQAGIWFVGVWEGVWVVC